MCSGNSRHETADRGRHIATFHPLQTDHTWHTYLQTQSQTYIRVPTLLLTKKSRTFPGLSRTPRIIFQHLFTACECLNIKKTGIYLQYSECRQLQKIQHEAKCGHFAIYKDGWASCFIKELVTRTTVPRDVIFIFFQKSSTALKKIDFFPIIELWPHSPSTVIISKVCRLSLTY